MRHLGTARRGIARSAAGAAWSAVLVGLLYVVGASAEEAVHYRVILDPAKAPLIDVEMELRGFTGAPLRVHMPLGYAYVAPRGDHVENLTGLDPTGHQVEPRTLDGGVYGWDRAPERIRYQVRLDHRRDAEERARELGLSPRLLEHPYVGAQHALLVGAATFLIPDRPEARVSVEIAAPDGWTTFTEWPEEDGSYQPASFARLLETYVGVGKWTVRRSYSDGVEVTVLSAPTGPALPYESFNLILDALRAQREDLGPLPDRRCVLFRPDAAGEGGAEGSVRSSTAVLLFDGGNPRNAATARMLARELAALNHAGRQPFGSDLRFYADGFFEYRAHLVAIRLGLETPEDAAEALADAVAGLSAKRGSLFEAQRDHARRAGAAEACRAEGAARAALADVRLREASGGERTLTDFMRHLATAGLPERRSAADAFGFSDWTAAAREWWPAVPSGALAIPLDKPLVISAMGSLAALGLIGRPSVNTEPLPLAPALAEALGGCAEAAGTEPAGVDDPIELPGPLVGRARPLMPVLGESGPRPDAPDEASGMGGVTLVSPGGAESQTEAAASAEVFLLPSLRDLEQRREPVVVEASPAPAARKDASKTPPAAFAQAAAAPKPEVTRPASDPPPEDAAASEAPEPQSATARALTTPLEAAKERALGWARKAPPAPAVSVPDRPQAVEPGRAPLLRYIVTVDPSRAPVVDVEIAVTAPEGSPLTLQMPLGYAYTNVASDHVDALIAVDARGGELEPRKGPEFTYRWARAPRTVRYSVRMDHREEIRSLMDADTSNDMYEHPFVGDRSALLMGSALFLMPTEWEHPIEVRIEGPEGWAVMTPWPEEKDSYRPESLTALAHNYVAMGAWTTRSFSVEDMEITAAFAEGVRVDHDRMAAAMKKLLEAEIKLFGRAPEKECLVLFVEPGDRKGLGGSTKEDSVVVVIGRGGAAPSEAEVIRLLAHEFIHLFNHRGERLDDDLRFFGEGFTEYLARVLCVRLGLHSPRAFTNAIEAMVECGLRVPEGTTLETAQKRFFEDADMALLCYAGGFLRALELDIRLREASEGKRTVDGLMRFIYNDALPERGAGQGRFTKAEWTRALEAWWPDAPEGLFDMHLDEPTPWGAPETLLDNEADRGERRPGAALGRESRATLARILGLAGD